MGKFLCFRIPQYHGKIWKCLEFVRNPLRYFGKEDATHRFTSKEEQAIAEGKPQNIVNKIAEGKLGKFIKENTLLNQSFVKDNKLTIAKYLESVQQGLTVEKFKRIAIGG